MHLPQLNVGQVCLGVAVALPTGLAERLARARVAFCDPDAETAPPHITVLPPVAVDQDKTQEVVRHLDTVAAIQTPFKVRLRSTGSFRPVTPVVFVQVDQGFDHCVALEEKVRRGPLGLKMRFPYHPHVTVAHGVSNTTLNRAMTALAGFDETFTVGQIDLWELDPDGAIESVAHFNFQVAA